jgi:hypothetical protein
MFDNTLVKAVQFIHITSLPRADGESSDEEEEVDRFWRDRYTSLGVPLNSPPEYLACLSVHRLSRSTLPLSLMQFRHSIPPTDVVERMSTRGCFAAVSALRWRGTSLSTIATLCSRGDEYR